jgi:hypothetical protein
MPRFGKVASHPIPIEDGKDTELRLTCVECHEHTFVKVRKEQLDMFLAGAKVQDAFPELTIDIRELFLSGFCGTCWNDVMKDEEQE